MAGRPQLSRRRAALATAGLSLLASAPLVGAGPLNGDAAVYWHAAQHGLFAERWIHAAYVLLLAPLPSLAAADLFSAVAVALGCARVAWCAGLRAGLLMVAATWPLAAFTEVDPLWWLGVVAAATAGPRWGGAALAAAVAISPTALAAVPWLLLRHRDGRALGAVFAVAALVLASGGAWLDGRRGLLTGGWASAPLDAAVSLLVPSLLASGAAAPVALSLSPVLLAPGDVPAWWIAATALALGGTRAEAATGRWRAVRDGLLGLYLLSGLAGLVTTQVRVRAENDRIQAIGDRLAATDAVEGPWSWRVRVALAATGDPDGLAAPADADRVFRVPDGERIR